MHVWLGLVFVLALGQSDQSRTGDLRVAVADSTGLELQGDVDLTNQANQFHEHLTTDAHGVLTVRRLPFGSYQVVVTRQGFAPFSGMVEIRTALPTSYPVTLMVATIDTSVTVSADQTLLDLRRTSTVHAIGEATVAQRLSSLPGRSVANLVDTQPGWLMEANGVLHPRGSEYQVQYVVDGLPLTDNRSAAFTPGLEADDVHALSILTGGYPAEYGRKLGGVVEVATAGQAPLGFHGNMVAEAGSFATGGVSGMGQYSWPRTTFSVSADGARTDRYLDPPVEENFTNHGATSNVAVHVERQLTDMDRFGVIVRRAQNAFNVPNELVQEEAGQAQHRTGDETIAQVSYSHLFSASMLAEVRGMVRNVSATLTSNELSTPIAAAGDRRLRDTYVKAALTINKGRHEWKVGGEASAGQVHEQFGYQLTDPDQFDPGTPPTFSFSAASPDREQALFIQDQARLGPLTVNAGLRWDHYRLVVDEQALSPRLAAAWAWPSADLTVRASYDRVFQTPAVENLLLASSPEVDELNPDVVRLPVRPSRGHFFEVGASKRLADHLRVDVSHYWRDMTHFTDDDVLLNTGVSFPIAFEQGSIRGTEVQVEATLWRGFSGFLSYSNMTGVGTLPITGGLLLGDEATEALNSTEQFPISQDQRHSLRGRVMYQFTPRVWVAFASSYGSGLPVEFAGDPADALAQYGPRIVSQVDFEEGRVRPNLSLDASLGVSLVKTKTFSLRLQTDVLNMLDRLNVINFAGLFSGTALAPPRSVAFRLNAGF